MNAADASGQKLELGLVWRVIPALWLLVGLGGFSTLAYWPQWFADPQRTDIIAESAESAESAECSMVFAAISVNTGADTPPDARPVNTSMDVFDSISGPETRTENCKRNDGY